MKQECTYLATLAKRSPLFDGIGIDNLSALFSCLGARRDDAGGLEQQDYAVFVCLHVNADRVRARQRLRGCDDFRRSYQLDQRSLAVCIVCRDSKRAGKDMEDIIS